MSGKSGGNTLTFDYKKIPNGLIRPIIRAEISLARGQDGVPCEVLVDSGADHNIFKAEIGELLGLDVKSGDLYEFQGINGKKSKGYIHRVWICVKGTWFQDISVFSDEVPKGTHQVVGQVGFFNHFKVNFDYRKKAIILRPKA